MVISHYFLPPFSFVYNIPPIDILSTKDWEKRNGTQNSLSYPSIPKFTCPSFIPENVTKKNP
jgi:hypothetical protein